jgi:hypothetical protein
MTELTDGLKRLADEVRVVDLYDGVMRGARRARNRDRAIGSALVVATTAGALMTANTFLSSPPPFDPSPEPSLSPSAEASLKPSPSPIPSPSPSPSPSPASGSGQVDFRNTTLEIVIPVGRGVGKVTDGVGTVEINTLYDVTIHSSAILDGGTVGVVIVEIRAWRDRLCVPSTYIG